MSIIMFVIKKQLASQENKSPADGEVYWYTIMWYSLSMTLWQVGGFLRVFGFLHQ